MTKRPAPSARATIPCRPGVASSGSATIPAVRWMMSEASARSRLASRPPTLPSEAAPISRSEEPVAWATQAPSSSAAQSWLAAPKGTTTDPPRSEPPASTSKATSHGACSRTTLAWPSNGDGPASIRTKSTLSCDASRTMSSPGVGEEKAAVLAASPSARSSSRRSASAAVAAWSSAGSTIPRRSARAAASTPRAAEREPGAPQGRQAPSERSGALAQAALGPPTPVSVRSPGSSRAGSCRRIACSSCFSSSLGSRPSSSESSRRAAR